WKMAAGATPRNAPGLPLIWVFASVTVLVNSVLPRWIVTVTVLSGARCRMAESNWVQLRVGWPPKATILSPGRRPRRAAGEAGSSLAQPAVFELGTQVTTV